MKELGIKYHLASLINANIMYKILKIIYDRIRNNTY